MRRPAIPAHGPRRQPVGAGPAADTPGPGHPAGPGRAGGRGLGACDLAGRRAAHRHAALVVPVAGGAAARVADGPVSRHPHACAGRLGRPDRPMAVQRPGRHRPDLPLRPQGGERYRALGACRLIPGRPAGRPADARQDHRVPPPRPPAAGVTQRPQRSALAARPTGRPRWHRAERGDGGGLRPDPERVGRPRRRLHGAAAACHGGRAAFGQAAGIAHRRAAHRPRHRDGHDLGTCRLAGRARGGQAGPRDHRQRRRAQDLVVGRRVACGTAESAARAAFSGP